MPEFEVVYGRLSTRYNHFEEYAFMNCQVTDTRLMGALALKITWKGITKPQARYYQVLHLDYSEYGIDEYVEFECIPGKETYGQNKEDMNFYWQRFTGSMGGRVTNVSANILLRLVADALPLASDDKDREYDTDENRDFRHYALRRLDMMRDVLHAAGFDEEKVTSSQAISSVSPRRLAICDTINYFVMRLVDHDFAAAANLSTLEIDDLKECPLTDAGIQTLVRSNIQAGSSTDHSSSYPYECSITTLGRDGYYYSTFVIFLNGDYKAKNPLVTDIRTGTVMKLTEYEAALQINQPEYISVYKCDESIIDGFDGRLINPFSGTAPVPVPNGWLYSIYNDNNSHVNKTEYRLGNDVFGYALLTVNGEFIIMSHNYENCNKLDHATMFSYYSVNMKLTGRYLLESTSVFQTLCQMNGIWFNELIMPTE